MREREWPTAKGPGSSQARAPLQGLNGMQSTQWAIRAPQRLVLKVMKLRMVSDTLCYNTKLVCHILIISYPVLFNIVYVLCLFPCWPVGVVSNRWRWDVMMADWDCWLLAPGLVSSGQPLRITPCLPQAEWALLFLLVVLYLLGRWNYFANFQWIIMIKMSPTVWNAPVLVDEWITDLSHWRTLREHLSNYLHIIRI